jgi:hypothetical protein
MDAYLICDRTRKAMWLGKPIRSLEDKEQVIFFHRGWQGGPYNHEDPELNKLLWKFLADNGREGVRVVFSGEYDEDAYDRVGSGDVETSQYLEGWPER